tara:strand:+ start:464 stop:1687 length:1224 start_codon:yes stop_codon:yes gene_type:complete
MVLVSHPTGNQFVRHLLLSLQKEGLLSEFWTCINWPREAWQNRVIPRVLLKDLMRRSFHDVDNTLIETYPRREIGRLGCKGLGLSFLSRHERGMFSLDKVYQSLDKRVSRRLKSLNVNAVYAYEDGALKTFQQADKIGVKKIYDLPIAYWSMAHRLYAEEVERLPEWAVTMEGILDSERKLARKTEEIELADVVVCPSKFVHSSLPDLIKENKKCIVTPFGSPLVRDFRPTRKLNRGVLRVLFAGSMSQRKGLGDLFQAMKLVDDSSVELHVLGSLLAPLSFYKSQYRKFFHHRSRSHDEVLKLMRDFDVFCLPSIIEGRALVVQEAMMSKLPVIITPNTGGEDLVEEGETGFLVPIRSPEKIAEKITWFLENKDSIEGMGLAAKKKAESITWKNYGDMIIQATKGD